MAGQSSSDNVANQGGTWGAETELLVSLGALGVASAVMALYLLKRYKESKRRAAEDKRIYSFVYIPLLMLGAAFLWFVLFKASVINPTSIMRSSLPAGSKAEENVPAAAASTSSYGLWNMFGVGGGGKSKEKKDKSSKDKSTKDNRFKRKILWCLICAACLLLVYLKRATS